MFRSFLLSACLLCCSTFMHSQSIFNSASVLNIQSGQGEDYFIVKNLKAQDINGIAKSFHVSVSELLKVNGIKNLDAFKNGNIKVPFREKILIREKSRETLHKKDVDLYLPVYYTAKKGETLYKVSKVSGEAIPALKKRNKSIGEDLNIGEKVLLGWVPISNSINKTLKTNEDKNKHSLTIAKEKIATTTTAKSQANTLTVKAKEKTKEQKKEQAKMIKDSIESNELLKKIQLQNEGLETARGIAHWAPSPRSNNKKYALHDTAPINSTILLYNPMLKKSTTAKVIGRIPKDNFGKDVSIVLSSAAAESLGARDARFMIDMKFHK